MKQNNQVISSAAEESHKDRLYVQQLKLALLKRIEVQRRLNIARATLYAKLNPEDPSYDPAFPVPVRIGARAVRWIESEVEAYIASLPRTRMIAGSEA